MSRHISIAAAVLASSLLCSGLEHHASAQTGHALRPGETERQCVERFFSERYAWSILEEYRKKGVTARICPYVCHHCIKLDPGTDCVRYCKRLDAERG